jgi:hypothetical protein
MGEPISAPVVVSTVSTSGGEETNTYASLALVTAG